MSISRRGLLGAAGATAAVGATSGCSVLAGSVHTGTGINDDAQSVNDMTVQEGTLAYTAWNQVKGNTDQQYPVALLQDSLELRQQREKVLRFNKATKPGWIYLFGRGGQLVTSMSIQGKPSSTQSSMTSPNGVYSDGGSGGGGNVAVPLPGDDLSWGPNEGGDAGTMFYNAEGVMMIWTGDWLYADAPFDLPDSMKQAAMTLPDGSKPSSVAEHSTLFAGK